MRRYRCEMENGEIWRGEAETIFLAKAAAEKEHGCRAFVCATEWGEKDKELD